MTELEELEARRDRVWREFLWLDGQIPPGWVLDTLEEARERDIL